MSSRSAPAQITSGCPAIGHGTDMTTTGSRGLGCSRRSLVICGHLVTGAGTQGFMYGTTAIGDRTSVSMVALTMAMDTSDRAMKADTGAVARSSTTRPSTA